ncbi:MAG: iron-containing alcohol dehydrogenase [Geminicoccaceae bacterium]
MARSRSISTGEHRSLKEPIEVILSGAYHLPETKTNFSCPIKRLCIAPDLSGQERDLIDALGLPGRHALICDPNTHDALGQRLAQKLPNADLVVIDKPKADEAQIADLIDKTRHAETLIAVGAGTLNDLAKYVSHQRGRPYAVFPTAPSMNGYTTTTASISRGGEKRSHPAAPPVGVFFDLNVLANAPHRLIQAGVGDSLCRSIAQVDWLLSHRLNGTDYMATPFSIQTEAEADLVKRFDQLNERDLDAVAALVRLLVLGGLGMLMAGSSQPGSQGEHLISHYIDMFCDPHPGTLHGEQVGLATWTMANLQQDMLKRASPPVLGEAAISRGPSAARYGNLIAASKAKALSGRRLDRLNQQLERLWPSLRTELSGVSLSPDQLKKAFDAAGVAMDTDALGIDRNFYGDAVRNARQLRDRFTMLDLAADTGHLAPFVEWHLQSTGST